MIILDEFKIMTLMIILDEFKYDLNDNFRWI